MNETTPELPLPALHQAVLDAADLEALLRDIEQCAELLAVLPKQAATEQIGDPARLTLADARDLLARRTVRGLQIRYRHDGAEWWDTLMQVSAGWRLVRIRHEVG